MSLLRLDAAWLGRLAAAVQAPPRRPREALWWQGRRIGSIEPDLFAGTSVEGRVRRDAQGWQVVGELTSELAAIAEGLRDAGRTQAWRNESLAVRSEDGELLATIERGAVRPLGIATHAVHLLAVDEQGRHWLQLRAFDKDTDPGLWDTLVGGMVPAAEPLPQALERETWEEAGLRPAQLRDLRHGGRLRTARPTSGGRPYGYAVQDIDWYTCVLPAGVLPSNQDGEVAQFRLATADEVRSELEQDRFTVDAAQLLVEAFGRAG